MSPGEPLELSLSNHESILGKIKRRKDIERKNIVEEKLLEIGDDEN